MVRLKCAILAETKGATLLRVERDENGQLDGFTAWFPKSQTRLTDATASIAVPQWMYEAKVTEARYKGPDSAMEA
jgi:hypothetical protein